MQYFKYLNEKIGNDSITKGRAYPPYLIEYSEIFEEQKEFVHNFFVDSVTSDNIYEVTIKNNGDEIYDGTCTCLQYEKNHTCKHLAACLLYYRNSLYETRKKDEYKESLEILNLFYDPTKNLNVKERLKIRLNFSFYRNEVTFRLDVGLNKLYVLNNKGKFEGFIEAYTHGGEYKLGTKLIYNKNNYYFDKEDSKIIDYLANYERNYYSKDIFVLNERELDYLIERLTPDKILINNNDITNVINGMPSNFNLNQLANKDYELILTDTINYEILTSSCKYVLYKSKLYILSNEEATLLNEFRERDINKIVFKKNNVEKFNRGILKNIKDNLVVSEKIDLKIETKPEASIYLDIASTLKCEVKLKYSNVEINIFDENKDIIRDYNYEEEIMQDLLNSGFTIESKKITISDIDNIGYFLENNLANLSEKYNIFTSKKFNSVNLIKQSRIKKDFSIGTSGIMSFNFNIDNINMNELKDIFNSLEKKKTYHKLKNGDIINLEANTELKELESLTKDLEINPSDITESNVIPKYKALYIDSLRNNKYQNITTNNLFNNFIKNFQEYKDYPLKFSEYDDKILRDYQKVGVKWLYTLYKCDLGGILADEMGLGKSIETICFLKEVIKNKPEAKILIVCPTSLVYNWQKEFTKFGGELKVTIISDSKKKRQLELNKDYNIYITSYGLLRNDIKDYQEKEFEICIIDEAQYIKNYQAKMTLCLKSLNARTKLALTGTPIENSVIELWSIFDFLMPGYLNSVKKFREKYHISDVKKEDLERLENLNYLIKPFILRRKKKEVYEELPDKIENDIFLELPDNQKKLYLKTLKETEEEINETIEKEGFKKAQFKILQLLTKLRQICIDPSVLYENYEGEVIKIEKLIEIVKDYTKENHKILIFSSFKRILDLLKIRLNTEHISYYSLDGTTKSKDRMSLVEKFNNDNTSCFLITLKSGGTGLNLTSADIVIHLDIWWNPQAENQATDRAHRIGQTKKVIVNRLITKGTIEERILELQNKKRILSESLIEGNANSDSLSNLTEEELKELLTFSGD